MKPTIRRTGAHVAGPPKGVVEVWRVPLAPASVPLAWLTAPLSTEEWAHATRMRVGGEAWAAARGALRRVLARYRACEPRELGFRELPDGKPELADGGSPRFSVSHTDGLALIAAASDREVGVDVERESDAADLERLAADHLPANEVASVRMAAPEARRRAFFAAWTRHEARLKLRGQGLEGTSPSLGLGPGGLVLVRALSVPEGFAAAVAAEGGSWAVALREISELERWEIA